MRYSLLTTLVVLLWANSLAAQQPKFYPDDPLTKEPPPLAVQAANYRALNGLYELVSNTVSHPGAHPSDGVIPAGGVNTLGEVLDGPWFINRHGRSRLTAEELTRGPGNDDPPSTEAPWRVLTVKRYDVRPGILVADRDNRIYLLQFDIPGRLEMSSGAAMIGSRIVHALGYWVPEHYIVYFERSQLVASVGGKDINAVGKARRLAEEDINLFLEKVPRDARKGYRALALKVPENAEMLGPYQFHGTRKDDPNDIVPHEQRRDLRGLYATSAWLGNNWVSAVQTQDALVEENGVHFLRHYIVDFVTNLGSGFKAAKSAWEGNESVLDAGAVTRNFLGFGFYAPQWQRAHYPNIASVGMFEYETFDPAKWVPNYDSAAIANHLPDDDYWAAKQILSFTNEDLRAIVKTAQYSDPRAEEWIARCLIERRDKIGRYFLDRVLPLDNFRIEDGRLLFDDLAAHYGFRSARNYSVEWFEFRNLSRQLLPIAWPDSFEIPERALSSENGTYWAARASSGEIGKTLIVYLRRDSGGMRVVGIDRDWPGKVLATERELDSELSDARFQDLLPRQREIFERYTMSYNQKASLNLSSQEAFRLLTLSEQTTFDAVTHALLRTELTDASGNSVGNALDLVDGVERLAGQEYGRQGDEQFRLYVLLHPNALQTLERSQQFRLQRANTVYHIGYPFSYRQVGSVPNIQFSVSEDGLKADIDVDYRSSRMPQAMWNGHLTAANSDVRAGDNYERHDNRWSGLVNWWSQLFGGLPEAEKDETALLATKTPEPATALPPDRPSAAPVAEVHEATQELLTDWLVRRKYREAIDWVSDQALACVRLDESDNGTTIASAEARERLRQIMEALARETGRFDNLTEVIEAVTPWRSAFRVVHQPFEGEFAIVEAPDSFASAFRCDVGSREEQQRALAGPDLRYGNYYGAIFRFKIATSRGGILGLLWTRENGAWRVVAWQVYDQ